MKNSNPNPLPKYVVGDQPLPKTDIPSQEPEPWGETEKVGKARPRIDAYERVSGSAQFTYDVMLPGMLYGAVLRSPHAHANVLKIDTAAAEQMPGVHKVITGATPGCDIDWYYNRRNPQAKLFEKHVRHHGEEIAAVAAETPQQAHDALEKIVVEYEVLANVVSIKGALSPEAPKLYPEGNKTGDSEYSRGDLAAGFAAADEIVEMEFNSACQIHSPLEVHGTTTKWDGDKLTVWESTQGVYGVLNRLAPTLRVPKRDVQVICKYVGGAFGGKLSANKQSVISALLAKLTARPVRVMLDREDEMTSVGNRPAAEMKIRIGAKKDGTITAIDYTNYATSGAFRGGASTAFQIIELYTCENVKYVEHFSYINAGQAAAFRAPGFPQVSWTLEQAMDEMAKKLGICPVKFRIDNAPIISQSDQEQRPYTKTGFAEAMKQGAKAFNWDDKPKEAKSYLKRGIGVAGSVWVVGGGGPPSTVTVRMFEDANLILSTGATDIGTGTKTILATIAAEELGIPISKIRVENADTSNTPYATPSGGSKTLPTEGPATRNAAFDLKNKLLALAARQLKVPAEELTIKDVEVVHNTDAEIKKSLAAIIRAEGVYDVIGVGYRGPNPSDKVIRTWSAQFCEVEVNTLTGKVTVERFLAAQDSGRVINPLTYNNQVHGGITMGIGFGMTEGRVLDEGQSGRMLNNNMIDYKLPTAMEVPWQLDVVPIDMKEHDCNNLGAKGLGEPPTIPTAAAIANAIHNAVGVRVSDTPVTPVQMMQLLSAKEQAND
jgi:CO/xanthine dehydrogenase Mo-binding subunit